MSSFQLNLGGGASTNNNFKLGQQQTGQAFGLNNQNSLVRQGTNLGGGGPSLNLGGQNKGPQQTTLNFGQT
jgi:hypothetical protein